MEVIRNMTLVILTILVESVPNMSVKNCCGCYYILKARLLKHWGSNGITDGKFIFFGWAEKKAGEQATQNKCVCVIL